MSSKNSQIVRRTPLLILLVLLSCWYRPEVSAAEKTPSVSYKVSFTEPQKKSLHVLCEVGNLRKKTVRFSFPTWSPGVYKVRSLGDVITNLNVTDGKGRTLTATKVGQDTWEVVKGEDDLLRVEYDLDVSNRTHFLDKDFISDTLAIIKGASTFCYFNGYLDAPASVAFVAPAGWKLISSLPGGPDAGSFAAKDFYELIDSPVMAGDFQTDSVSTRGTNFVVAVDSQLGVPPARLVEMVRKVADYQIGLFGDAPFKTYTFLVHTIPDPYFNTVTNGIIGVEHQSGSEISVTPQYARVLKGMRDPVPAFEPVFSHEMFHSWNGKRIKPMELDKPDLQSALQSPNIWFVEGVTRYFDILSVYRINGAARNRLYESLSSIIRDGNVKQSLASESRQVSQTLSRDLYNKGALVALAIDLEIRAATDNKRSLADVMRSLYSDAKQSKTYTEQSLQKTVEAVAGKSLEEFFRRYVVGDESLDVNSFLGHAGLKADISRETTAQDIGIYFNRANNKVVGLVTDGAGFEAGLRPGDRILSIDGEAIETRPFQQFFKSEEIGSKYVIRVMRDDKEMDFDVKIRPYEKVTVNISEVADASERQLKVRSSWLEELAKVAESERPTTRGGSSEASFAFAK